MLLPFLPTMKSLLRLALIGAVLVPVALCAASFEGKLGLKLSAGGSAAQEMQYLVKGDKVRMEMPAHEGMAAAIIIEPAKRRAVMLMDTQKMAMVMTLPDPATAAPGEAASEAPKLEKTGEKEKILGQTAEKYIVTHQGTKSDLWLAEGLGAFVAFNPGGPMMGGRGGAPAPKGWERALAGKELFPLRVVSYDKAGRETSRMDVTAIEKKSLPDSLFTVPAGYQQMDMSAMMRGGMPGGFPGAPR
jgi:hypothetical protein